MKMYLISEEDKALLDLLRINTEPQHASDMSISSSRTIPYYAGSGVPSHNDSDTEWTGLNARYQKLISTGTPAVPAQTPPAAVRRTPMVEEIPAPQVIQEDIPQKSPTKDLYCTGEKTKKEKKRKATQTQTQTTPTESAKKERTCTEQLKQCKAELELCKIHGWLNLQSGTHYSPMHKLPSMDSSVWTTPRLASTPIPKKEQSGRPKRHRYEPDRFVPSGKKRLL